MLRAATFNGWAARGEQPRVGIMLAICATLFAVNAIVQLAGNSAGTTESTSRLIGVRWAAAVAAPSITLGVVSMLVLYLLTGTTRTAQLPVPMAHTSTASIGLADVPLPGSIHTPGGVPLQAVVQIVRQADILRSECLWLTVAATVFALATLALQARILQTSNIGS